MAEPHADRPIALGYFVREYTADLLPWSWAVDLMNRVRNPTLSTVRPDGRAHAMPVWGIWLDPLYCVSTAITSVKSANLKTNPACAVTTTEGDDTVVLEGRAELSDLPAGFTAAYKQKYGAEIETGPIWVVRPTVVFAFRVDDSFYKTATRWRFT